MMDVYEKNARLLAAVEEYNRKAWERELRERIALALAAGLPETRVAEAAGITRVTLRAWMNRRWVVEVKGEPIEITGRAFHASQIARTLTDLPVEIAGFDGTHADDLEPGQASTMEVVIATAPGKRPRSLRFVVTRVE